MGQAYYQSKFFYDFMKKNPGNHYITDSNTAVGLKFLNKYEKLNNLETIHIYKFLDRIKNPSFNKKNKNAYLLLNLPVNYDRKSINLDERNFSLSSFCTNSCFGRICRLRYSFLVFPFICSFIANLPTKPEFTILLDQISSLALESSSSYTRTW